MSQEAAQRPRTTTRSLASTGTRALGGSLDATIRALRSAITGIDELAERTLRAWRDAGLSSLTIDATTIQSAGRDVLSASGDAGRWILPAFMSGLREIRPRSTVSSDDVRHLSQHLADLEVSEGALQRFQNWVWSEGAEGFDLVMEQSFVEVFDAQAAASSTPPAIAGVRAAAVAPLGSDSVAVAVDDLDVAALRTEMEAEIDVFHRAVERRELEISGQTMRALGVSCDDPAGWAIAELDAVLANPPLRTAFPPDRLARRLAARIGQRCDGRLLTLLTSMNASVDPYVARAMKGLVVLGVGEQVGRGVPLDDPAASAAFAKWLIAAAGELARPAIRAVLEREADRDQAIRVLGDLIESLGAERWIALLAPPTVAIAHASTIAEVLIRVGSSASLVAHLLRALPIDVAGRLSCRLPARTAAVHGARLGDITAMAAIDVALDVFDHVSDDATGIPLVDRIVRTRGVGWAAPQLQRLVATWQRAKLAPSPLTSLIHARRVDGAARLALLRALAPWPHLQVAVARRRFAGLFDPPDLRRELREIRRRES